MTVLNKKVIGRRACTVQAGTTELVPSVLTSKIEAEICRLDV